MRLAFGYQVDETLASLVHGPMFRLQVARVEFSDTAVESVAVLEVLADSDEVVSNMN